MLFLLAFILAPCVYFGLRQILWNSDLIPMLYRNLGRPVSLDEFLYKYNIGFVCTTGVLFVLILILAIFTPLSFYTGFKMLSGFWLICVYLLVFGKLKNKK